MDVRLEPVEPSEYDEYFAHFPAYHAELDAYDPRGEPFDSERWRRAVLDDLEDRELLWIVADGERAGFAMLRISSDWPEEERTVVSISEFGILPDYRRRGVGSAAVRALLEEHRGRGTFLVEASILRDNAPAKAFWAALGFEVQSVLTARRP